MVLEDSLDYLTTSPVEQGPWAIPQAWGGNGASLDLFKEFLEAATTVKVGCLAPVERVAPGQFGIYLTAKGIANYRARLLAPRDSKKPKALLVPSFDSKRLRRFPHMLPAVARTIIRDFDAIARLYSKTEDECSLEELTERSPSKAALKREVGELTERVASLEGEVSELKSKVTQSEKSKVRGGGGGGCTVRYGTYGTVHTCI